MLCTYCALTELGTVLCAFLVSIGVVIRYVFSRSVVGVARPALHVFVVCPFLGEALEGASVHPVCAFQPIGCRQRSRCTLPVPGPALPHS